MSESSRRGFLKIAGAGAAVGAAVTAAALTRSDGDRPAAAAGTADALPAGASGALVAYVRDLRSAEVSVMVGEAEVVVHDRDLVARLAAARRSGTA